MPRRYLRFQYQYFLSCPAFNITTHGGWYYKCPAPRLWSRCDVELFIEKLTIHLRNVMLTLCVILALRNQVSGHYYRLCTINHTCWTFLFVRKCMRLELWTFCCHFFPPEWVVVYSQQHQRHVISKVPAQLCFVTSKMDTGTQIERKGKNILTQTSLHSKWLAPLKSVPVSVWISTVSA